MSTNHNSLCSYALHTYTIHIRDFRCHTRRFPVQQLVYLGALQSNNAFALPFRSVTFACMKVLSHIWHLCAIIGVVVICCVPWRQYFEQLAAVHSAHTIRANGREHNNVISDNKILTTTSGWFLRIYTRYAYSLVFSAHRRSVNWETKQMAWTFILSFGVDDVTITILVCHRATAISHFRAVLCMSTFSITVYTFTFLVISHANSPSYCCPRNACRCSLFATSVKESSPVAGPAHRQRPNSVAAWIEKVLCHCNNELEAHQTDREEMRKSN